MTVSKPLQLLCSSAACRRRQTVAVDRAWYVDVKNGPGSHREAGWRCRFCGMENTTPSSHLPRDTIPLLASRQDVLDRVATFHQSRKELDVDHKSLIVEAEVPDVSEKVSIKSSPSMAIAETTAATKSSTKRDVAVAGPNVPAKLEHCAAKGIVEPEPPVPTWVVGSSARTVLIDALVKILRHGGDAVAMSDRRSGFEQMAVALPGDDMDPGQIARFADDMLTVLDEMRADFVVLGGNVHGRRWHAILHITAGAASFV